jgi:hypothetical protein
MITKSAYLSRCQQFQVILLIYQVHVIFDIYLHSSAHACMVEIKRELIVIHKNIYKYEAQMLAGESSSSSPYLSSPINKTRLY